MESNKPLVAFLIGALATIPYEVFTRVCLFFKFGQYSAYQLSSLIITINRPRALIGGALCFLVGGLIATVFYYSLHKLGTDYFLIKGVIFSALSWAMIELLFTLALEAPKIIHPRLLSDYYIQMFGTMLFGLNMAWGLKKMVVRKAPPASPY